MSSIPAGPEYSPFLQHYQELERFLIRRTGSRDEASDLVQETFLRLMRLKDPRAIANPRAWLFQTASNLFVDGVRKVQVRARHAAPAEHMDEVEADTPSPYDRAVSREQWTHLENAIRNLPQPCREVFYLHRFEGLSHQEIAEKLRISKSTVEKRMIRALCICREALHRDAADPSSP